MKTKKLLWMIIALMLATTTAFSQGYGYANRPGRGYGYGNEYNSEYYGKGYGMGYGYGYGNQAIPGILNIIPGLTEEQKSKIQETAINHRKVIAELRVKEMSTTDISERTKIREEILKKVLGHHDEIRNLLNDEQKEHYDLLWSRGSTYGCMGYGRGYRRGRGCRGFGGRGRVAGSGPGGYGYRYGW
jgi:hypothetical protein